MSVAACVACGARYAHGSRPEVCRVCADDRQYVPDGVQSWTTPEALLDAGHRLVVAAIEPGLWRVTAEPSVAIGQRGYVVGGADGTVLWDPPALVEAAGLQQIRAVSDVVAVAMSHPHYYGAMAEWAAALDVPVLLPEEDIGWVTEPTDRVVTWSGEHEVLPELRLVRCGGHFPGSAVLHRGEVLLTGDTVQVVRRAATVSFAYSFPNHLPLATAEVEAVIAAATRRPFRRLYAAFGQIDDDALAVVHRGAARYLARLRGD